ncbi:MAG: tRNA (adenosine(37)-N6)-threonylcarbamoyltransferase complex ATPase subunit type 1 TsaE [Nocardioidaceae bacterium]
MSDLRVAEASVDDAEVVRDVIHAAFGPRPRVDPPSTALAETTASVAETLAGHGGLLCWVDGEPAGAVLFDDAGTALALRRVSAVPHFQSRGVASAIVGVAEEVAAGRGYDDVQLKARTELPATLVFWLRRGYIELTRDGTNVTYGKALPVELAASSADDTRAIGKRIAGLCRAGDVVILTGELGAGKTTLAQGLGEGLGVRGDVTSPTFVISRMHPSLVGGPALVHVDAYRLGDEAELDDLDLDAFVDDGVTVVEWGEGMAEALSDERLRVHVARSQGDSADELRTVTAVPVGARWFGAGVRSSLLATSGVNGLPSPIG